MSDALLHPVPKAREILGHIGNTKFYEIVNAGKIKIVHIGKRSFATDESLRSYVDELKAEAERTAGSTRLSNENGARGGAPLRRTLRA